MAVECGDHRLAQFEGGRVDRRRAAGEIRSGAEGPAGTGDHNGPHVVVRVAVPVGLTQQPAHVGGVGVEMLGAIECEHRHTRIDVNQHIGSHPSKYTTPPRAERAVSNFISLALWHALTTTAGTSPRASARRRSVWPWCTP